MGAGIISWTTSAYGGAKEAGIGAWVPLAAYLSSFLPGSRSPWLRPSSHRRRKVATSDALGPCGMRRVTQTARRGAAASRKGPSML